MGSCPNAPKRAHQISSLVYSEVDLGFKWAVASNLSTPLDSLIGNIDVRQSETRSFNCPMCLESGPYRKSPKT